jgi:Cdc6-like AAA superfamily ATPase
MNDESRSSIIVDHEMLRNGYIPEKLRARETQYDQVMCCLSPLKEKRKPIHVWLHGKPGTGKTTTAIHALRQLEQSVPVRSIMINCWKKTFYGILNEMISEFRILRAEEHRSSFKMERLRSFLRDEPIVILLDEIDQMPPQELSTTLYNLDLMLNATLICISNSTRPLDELEERVASRLHPYAIPFPAYTCKELFDILTHRAEQALVEGSYSQTALRQIAGTVRGDARAAIRMLHKAAVLASHGRVDRITTKTLREQFKADNEARIASALNRLTKDHQILFGIVKRKRRILSRDLWKTYLQRCERIKRKPLAARTFVEYCNRLAHMGLISSERARVRGKVKMFKVMK